jgi:hypothetical protein
MELKDELCSIGLTFLWKKQQECKLRDMIRIVNDRSNNIETQSSLATFPEKSSLTLYRKLNFLCGKKLYTERCSRKERSGITLLIAGVCQLKVIRQVSVKGS